MKQIGFFEAGNRDKLLLDLFKAYYDSRRNKRNTRSALAFELHYERELFRLYDEINDRRYIPRPSICFIVNKPVKREVFAADFRDRIIHHYIYNQIAPVFENRFINDSYSCRVGKGTHYGIRRVDHFIRSCSGNYHRDCHILKIDIKGYFMSIDRSLLYRKIKATLVRYGTRIDGDLSLILYLIRQTIFNDPTNGCIRRSRKSEWIGLPCSKSLFYAGRNRGLPIGNLTSQLFANIYLDDFDHFMKRDLKLRYYGRYVDDIVVVHPEKEYLKSILPMIRDYLQENPGLQLHPKKIYLQYYSKGVVFLGAIIKPYRIYVSSRTKANFHYNIQKYNRMIKVNVLPSIKDTGRFVASMNSYLGIFRHYKTHRLVETMLKTVLSRNWLKWVSVQGNYAKFMIRK